MSKMCKLEVKSASLLHIHRSFQRNPIQELGLSYEKSRVCFKLVLGLSHEKNVRMLLKDALAAWLIQARNVYVCNNRSFLSIISNQTFSP
jgi:hypothetical protein